jgi:hypothetical protein
MPASRCDLTGQGSGTLAVRRLTRHHGPWLVEPDVLVEGINGRAEGAFVGVGGGGVILDDIGLVAREFGVRVGDGLSNPATVHDTKQTPARPSKAITTARLKEDFNERSSAFMHHCRQNSREGYGGSRGRFDILSSVPPGYRANRANSSSRPTDFRAVCHRCSSDSNRTGNLQVVHHRPIDKFTTDRHRLSSRPELAPARRHAQVARPMPPVWPPKSRWPVFPSKSRWPAAAVRGGRSEVRLSSSTPSSARSASPRPAPAARPLPIRCRATASDTSPPTDSARWRRTLPQDTQ